MTFFRTIAIAFGIAIAAQLIGTSFAAPFPTGVGGTGTSQQPASGTVLIGNGAGSYTAAFLTPGTNVTIVNASGSVTVSASGGATGTVVGVYQGYGVTATPSPITVSGTIALNTSTLNSFITAYNYLTAAIQTLQGLSTSSISIVTSTKSQSFDVTTQNGNQIKLTIPPGTDYLASSTVYVSTFNGASGAVTFSAPATTTINGFTGSTFNLLPGAGITSTIVNGSTTFTLNLSAGCSGAQFVSTISPTGTISCATPSGGASSTNVYGINGVTVTQVGVNATASLDTTYAASWSALETFLKGLTVNGTTTFASTTNAIIYADASGIVRAYLGTGPCPAGQAMTTLSATGTQSCAAFLTSGVATTTITASGTTLNGPSFTFASSATILSYASGTQLYWSLVNTGNWAGTWQGVNSSTFYLATNPNGYITTSTNNFGGLTNASITANAPVTWSVGSVIGFNTSTAMSLSGPYTFLGGVTANSTGTFNSSTAFTAYASFPCWGTNASGVPVSVSCITSAPATTTYTAQNSTITTTALTIATSGPLLSASVSGQTLTLTSIATSTILSGYSTSTGANPTASVGLSATNGAATTFMRSDAAPALSQSIAPTWTGQHTWVATGTFQSSTQLLGPVSVATTTGPGLAKILVNGQFKYVMPVNATATNPSTTIDFSVAARQMITLGAATTTIYLSNTESGDSDALKVCQDGTGSRTVTWAASSTNTTSTIYWGNAGAPTLSTTIYYCDWFTFLTSPIPRNTASSVVEGFYGQNQYPY